jgi:hypothetical protein
MATKPPALTDAFDEASQVPEGQVGRDPTERVLGMGVTPGGSLDRALQQHHQQRIATAQMYRKNAATAIGQIAKGTKWDATLNGGVGGERPLNDQEIQDLTAQKDEALQQYGKIIGVNKESKGALDKAHGIIDFILGRKQAQQQQQGRPGGMAAPPTPQYGSTVTEAGVIPTPMAGTNVGEAGVAPGPPPPARMQPSPLEQSIAAPFAQHQVRVGQLSEDAQRLQSAGVQSRQAIVKHLNLDESKPYIQDWVLTGQITGRMAQQLKLQKGGYYRDENGIPRQSVFYPGDDPATSGFLDAETFEKIPNYTPMSSADLTTHTLNIMTPDGPRTMFRVGNKVTDNHGNLQDGELVPFIRGMVPTTTDREVMGFDDQGNPTKYLLRSTRTINMGPTPSPMATPPVGGTTPQAGVVAPQVGGAGRATAAPSTSKGQGRVPSPQGGGPVAQGRAGGKTVYPAGQFMQFSKSATGVDQARNSLVGDEIEKGKVGGLAKDLDIFKDPSAVARIGEYLQLVHNLTAREGDSFAQSDDTIGAVKWFAGMPQAVIGLQQGALRDKYNQLTAADKKFVADYFRAMGTMGGMRASTGMPGYQWSFTNMYNEMPTPGKVTDYDDAVRRVMNYVNETNVVSKRNPMVPKVDVGDAEKQIRGSSGKMTPPPASGAKTASPKTASDYLSKFGIKPTQ